MPRTLLGLTLIASFAAGGCAAHRTEAVRRSNWDHQDDAVVEGDAIPASATASALVFRSPIADFAPPLDLWRDAREPSAFFGYEEGVVETYHIYTDDRQVFGWWNNGGGSHSGGGWGNSGSMDRYERRAEIDKVGVLRR